MLGNLSTDFGTQYRLWLHWTRFQSDPIQPTSYSSDICDYIISCEKLILKRMSSHIILNNVLLHSQFGFRCKHITTHQVHSIVDAISFSLEKKQYCSSVFLDLSQVFDRVWHQGLLYKLRKYLPSALFLLIKSYLTNCYSQLRFGSAFSDILTIISRVPQGSILPLFYLIFLFLIKPRSLILQ